VSFRVTTFVNGRWRQNCYIVTGNDGDAIVIDPGSQADDLIALVEKSCWRIHGIINTHGHFDHIGAVVPLQERYQAPFYLHKSDERLMQRANLFRMVFEAPDPVKIPTITQDISVLPEKFNVGPFSISWISTPGHTEGSVCLQFENMLFSGDTLMQNAIGRTDLPGGNRDRVLASVRKLSSLPEDTKVYGGHGAPTTIGAEFATGARVWSLLQ
jgi:glyoxylase-like metal-dependent hydrolase (beta-lactamase superfamily II)